MRIYFILFFLLFSTKVLAKNLHCEITPEIYHDSNIPKIFNTYNDLRHKQGTAFVAVGKPIKIKGILTDENCVPIQGATIYIWHPNAYGEYQYDTTDDKRIDKNFAGTGTSITNNMGEFNFITILPNEYTSKPPVIKFRIKHDDFISLDTILFFSDKDKILKKFDHRIAKRLVAIPIGNDNEYKFNITLIGTNGYSKY